MGMTVVEKILAKAALQPAVKALDVVEPRVDLAMSHENAALVVNQFKEIYAGTGREPIPWIHRASPSSSTTVCQRRAEDGHQSEAGPRLRRSPRHHQIPRHPRRSRWHLPSDLARAWLRATRKRRRRNRQPHDEPWRPRSLRLRIGATEMASVWTLGIALNVEVPRPSRCSCTANSLSSSAPRISFSI